MVYELPKLPYAFDALEPYIDEKTMHIHHGKHHAAYVSKLNAAIEGTEWEDMEIEELLGVVDDIPEDIKQTVINNGGGHANHSLFWEILSGDGGSEPEGDLADAINEKFESFEEFKDLFSKEALGRFGSGWAWLVVNEEGELEVISTKNQDSPLMSGMVPILGLDVWEHAYYLKYQNKRPDYVEAFWNVVNWEKVAENFEKAKG